MTEEEATKLVQEIFASSPFIKAWRVRSEACREHLERQADLLREAVMATVAVTAAQGVNNATWVAAIRSESEAWKAYKESL